LPGFVRTGGEFGGGIVTVNALPALDRPPTVTTTLPVVAPDGTGALMLEDDQLVGAAILPLKVTALAPCVDPKFEPAIVTIAPTTPLEGDRLVIVGVSVEGTVNETSGENELSCPVVLYARIAKKYVWPAFTVTTVLVTLPASTVVEYEPLDVPYES